MICVIRYGYTPEEIAEVSRQAEQLGQRALLFCGCGRIALRLSRDTGFGRGWMPAADLAARIAHGQKITGEQP